MIHKSSGFGNGPQGETDPAILREREYYAQALRDASACMASRRVNPRTNRCNCYCCTLHRQTYGRGE